MENFIVSARKYRPVTFESVVGQQHITNTLKNAISNNQLAQAFLFCGPRGVGKTTCARILAKTINCTNRDHNNEACGVCESCISFHNGNSFNVHELDAASNNSVDDIRNLIDQVRIPPQGAKYKVYIIDEVHMLSQSAFNAFLKTLEEPPPYAIFILATTEKHKILPTILSRCQIFDFNRIKVEDMAAHLASIAKKEIISYDNDGLHLIAQKADGGLRDALSMFDQIASFSGKNISYQAVIDNLNILDYDYYFKITDHLLNENIPLSLLLFDEILNNGFDGNHFITGFSSHLRNLLVSKDASTIKLLEVSENIKKSYLDQAKLSSSSFLITALNIANQCDLNYRNSKNQRLQVELCLIKIGHIASAIQLSQSDNMQQLLDEVKKKPKKLVEIPVNETLIFEESAPDISENNEKINTTDINKITTEEEKTKNNYLISKTSKLTTIIPDLNNLASVITNKAENAEPQYLSGDDKKDFNFEDFHKYWLEFIHIAKSQNKMSLVAIMENGKLALNENYQIVIEVDNKFLEQELTKEKIDLLNFLRAKLQNFKITLNSIIVENAVKKHLYTSSEKYQHMKEKNPVLEEFKTQFNLEIDF